MFQWTMTKKIYIFILSLMTADLGRYMQLAHF